MDRADQKNIPKRTAEEIDLSRDFRVDQIDHVELFVPNRFEASIWYQRVLGFQIIDKFKHWADDSGGPLMISSDGGNTKLALFEGTPQGKTNPSGIVLIAFRVSANSFLQFVDRLPELRLEDKHGRPVTSKLVVDHDQAFSIYFCDPFGNQLELTTYEHANVGMKLEKNRLNSID